MREVMPVCAAWVDALRDAFGHDFITGRIREGLADGTCWFQEGEHYIGEPGQPERDEKRRATEHRFNLNEIQTGENQPRR